VENSCPLTENLCVVVFNHVLQSKTHVCGATDIKI